MYTPRVVYTVYYFKSIQKIHIIHIANIGITNGETEAFALVHTYLSQCYMGRSLGSGSGWRGTRHNLSAYSHGDSSQATLLSCPRCQETRKHYK